MRLTCWECHKPCSNELPEDTVLRGTATCPECEEKKINAKDLLTEIIQTLRAAGFLSIQEVVAGIRRVTVGKQENLFAGGTKLFLNSEGLIKADGLADALQKLANASEKIWRTG